MKKEIIYCDVCEKEKPWEESYTPKNLDVIFTTDQEEGRSCKPYLSKEKLDICNKCYSILLEGNYIFASGAMGHNKYWFKNENKTKR